MGSWRPPIDRTVFGVPHHRLAEVDERPTWRGRTHLWAFGVALPATVVLVAGAHPGRPRLAALIYAVTLVAMFGFSAAHHRLGLTHRAGAVLRRLDHCAIYALIAGTYAPVCLVALPLRWGIPCLRSWPVRPGSGWDSSWWPSAGCT